MNIKNSTASDQKHLSTVLHQFDVPFGDVHFKPLGDGRIHQTFLAEYRHISNRYVLQKINTSVFKNTSAMIKNILFVSNFLKNNGLASISLMPLKSGEGYVYVDGNNEFFRVQDYLLGTEAYNCTDSKKTAFESGRCLGSFHSIFSNQNDQLIPHVRDFHKTSHYYRKLIQAHDESNHDEKNKVSQLMNEISKREELSTYFEKIQSNGLINKHVCHNDPKLSNILFSKHTKQALCLIDLDTVDLGFWEQDFGDAVRSICINRSNDTPQFHLGYFEDFCSGYFGEMKPVLSNFNTENFYSGIRVITFEIMIRYLTDYLMGNVYFNLKDPEETYLKAKHCFSLLKDLELNEKQIMNILKKF